MSILKTTVKVGITLAIAYCAARGCADGLKAAEIEPLQLEDTLNHTQIEYKTNSNNPIYDVLDENDR